MVKQYSRNYQFQSRQVRADKAIEKPFIYKLLYLQRQAIMRLVDIKRNMVIMMNEYRVDGELIVTTMIILIERNTHILRIQNRMRKTMMIKFHVNGEHSVMTITVIIERNTHILRIQNRMRKTTMIKFHVNGEYNVMIMQVTIERNIPILRNKQQHVLLIY
jgi:hypothetical protein